MTFRSKNNYLKPRIWSEKTTVQTQNKFKVHNFKMRLWFVGVWSDDHGRYVVLHVVSTFEEAYSYIRTVWFEWDAKQMLNGNF
jgi:hypothetical protein